MIPTLTNVFVLEKIADKRAAYIFILEKVSNLESGIVIIFGESFSIMAY